MEARRSQSIVQDRSFALAIRIVEYVRRKRKDFVYSVLTRQLLRSGTSIGANIEEALGGHSSKDFVAKLAIAAKEARETGYWLRLLHATQPHGRDEVAQLIAECAGILKMLNSIILTTRSKIEATKSQLLLRTPRSARPTQNSTIQPLNPEARTQNSELRTSDLEPRFSKSELLSP